ncbi:hypothetical protein ACFXK0_12200, partial [Nocardia sp. NPDC059177]|uniref:hypothetical protein n=1 Tax=Nocardia sp. NPDC059177 TaxID=3346759 RepID=UPI00368843DD
AELTRLLLCHNNSVQLPKFYFGPLSEELRAPQYPDGRSAVVTGVCQLAAFVLDSFDTSFDLCELLQTLLSKLTQIF